MPPLTAARDLPIRRKLVGAALLSSIASIVLTCGVFVAYDMIVSSGATSHGTPRDTAGLVARYGQVALAATVGASLLTAAGASWLAHLIARPLIDLALAAERTVSDHDYSTRAPGGGADEVGRMIDGFNTLLSQIQGHHAALRASHETLEARMDERTRAARAEAVELRATKRELAAAREDLECATRERRALLLSMSRELRTPLHAIIGYGQMLADEAGERGYAAAVPDLKRIVAAGQHLSDLLDDIVDLSTVTADRAEGVKETFLAARLLDDVLVRAHPLAERQGNTLTSEVAPDLGGVWGDPHRLQRVLLNLIFHAATVTERGTIEIGARRVRSDRTDRCDWLMVTVAGSGSALSPDLMRLFNESHPDDTSPDGALWGTRLGLMVSQRFSHLMGGRVTVSTRPTGGFTFTVMLPASGGERVLTTHAIVERPAGADPAGELIA